MLYCHLFFVCRSLSVCAIIYQVFVFQVSSVQSEGIEGAKPSGVTAASATAILGQPQLSYHIIMCSNKRVEC